MLTFETKSVTVTFYDGKFQMTSWFFMT